jgi:hypothetical protein
MRLYLLAAVSTAGLVSASASWAEPPDPPGLAARVEKLEQTVAALTEALKAKAGVPNGAIAYFDLNECPSGWTIMSDVIGRYVVGANQSVGLSVGWALGSQENRATGAHYHEIYSGFHIWYPQNTTWWHLYGARNPWILQSIGVKSGHDFYIGQALEKTEGADTQYWGLGWPDTQTPGTNAPYVQFLPCIKS